MVTIHSRGQARTSNDCCRNGLRDAMPGLANSNHIEIDVGLLQAHCDEGNEKKFAARMSHDSGGTCAMTADQLIAARRQTDGSLVVDLSQTAVAAESNAPLLSIKGLSVRFGGIVALDNVSFDVRAGQICGLIGPNGAGKTTLFNCVSRLYQPCAGTIPFAGGSLLRLPRHRLARLGIGRTFQNLALFQTMSARDNVLIGGHCRSRGGFVANALRLPIVGREERLLRERARS